MDWFLAAPFIRSASDRWLAEFIPDPSGIFHSVPADYRHDRSRRATGARDWGDYFRHGNSTWQAAVRSGRPSGILTCFPQLPLAIGLRKRLSRHRIPLVAWTFNLGTLHTGIKRRLAMAGLAAVDTFIVHSRAEIAACSEWLQLPADRFEFVPLQRGLRSKTFTEDREHPFILSMGTAHRDYKLLFAVLGELGFPAVVVTGPHAVAGLTVPGNVALRSGLSIDECHALVQRARLNVVPVANQTTASGQVTLVDAMMYGRPTIATACPASVDYVEHGKDGWLVRPGDHDDMKAAIARLWDDEALRERIGETARNTVINRYSDAAIARVLGQVLRKYEAR